MIVGSEMMRETRAALKGSDEVCQSCGQEIDTDGHCGCPWPCNVEGCTRPREEGCELCTQHTDEALADCGEK